MGGRGGRDGGEQGAGHCVKRDLGVGGWVGGWVGGLSWVGKEGGGRRRRNRRRCFE